MSFLIRVGSNILYGNESMQIEFYMRQFNEFVSGWNLNSGIVMGQYFHDFLIHTLNGLSYYGHKMLDCKNVSTILLHLTKIIMHTSKFHEILI